MFFILTWVLIVSFPVVRGWSVLTVFCRWIVLERIGMEKMKKRGKRSTLQTIKFQECRGDSWWVQFLNKSCSRCVEGIKTSA